MCEVKQIVNHKIEGDWNTYCDALVWWIGFVHCCLFRTMYMHWRNGAAGSSSTWRRHSA